MSDPASASWSCFRKKAYPDERMARQVAARVRETHHTNVVAYACPHCGRYHIGHASRPE